VNPCFFSFSSPPFYDCISACDLTLASPRVMFTLKVVDVVAVEETVGEIELDIYAKLKQAD
jgi:hypothetical protein